tara:strand:- start:1 stop:1287 length:1287 start_codon:yes stop_codon:yes gene_type:complete
MPYRKPVLKRKPKNSDNAFFSKIRGNIAQFIEEKSYDFYELEPIEVKEVLLDLENWEGPRDRDGNPDLRYYGAIKGSWIWFKKGQFLPVGDGWVIPLDPHIKSYPVRGESVVGVNYLGRTYYTTIINYWNNPNNSILTGLSDVGIKPKQAPPDIYMKPELGKPIQAEPGDLVIQGRYNNSINIGSQDMVGSSIKLVAGHSSDGTYDLKKDAASIYIQEKGGVSVKNPNSAMGENIVQGSKIVLDADYIVINAKKQLKLQGANLVEVVGKNTEVKHNAGGKIVTGETDKPIDEIREKTKKKLNDEAKKKLNEFKQTLKQTIGVQVQDFTNMLATLDTLQDKAKDAIEDTEKVVDKMRNTSFTLNAPKFTKVQDKVNKLQKDLAETPDILPNGSPNPKKFKLVADLINVFRSFSTLDFINEDIVTIEKKK